MVKHLMQVLLTNMTDSQDNFDRMQMKNMESDIDTDELVEANMDLLRDYHASIYTGLDDDMPEAYDKWAESLTEADIIKILYKNEKE